MLSRPARVQRIRDIRNVLLAASKQARPQLALNDLLEAHRQLDILIRLEKEEVDDAAEGVPQLRDEQQSQT